VDQNTWVFVLLSVGGLALAILIFVTAYRLVESARKGNKMFKWGTPKWASRFLKHPK
jgi:hypothetical protein